MTYTITINNVSDRATAPNPIDPNSQATFTVSPAPTGGLMAHWKLDEGAGSAAGDSSGNGHQGTVVGATDAFFEFRVVRVEH